MHVDVIQVGLDGLGREMRAIHLSLEKDISELKGKMDDQGGRISKTELRLAQLQGAGVVLTLALPFAAVGLNALVG